MDEQEETSIREDESESNHVDNIQFSHISLKTYNIIEQEIKTYSDLRFFRDGYVLDHEKAREVTLKP